jgi:hypothetical protein
MKIGEHFVCGIETWLAPTELKIAGYDAVIVSG